MGLLDSHDREQIFKGKVKGKGKGKGKDKGIPKGKARAKAKASHRRRPLLPQGRQAKEKAKASHRRRSLLLWCQQKHRLTGRLTRRPGHRALTNHIEDRDKG